MNFIMLGDGFDGVEFAELSLSQDHDAALLIIVDENGLQRSAELSEEDFVVTDDGRGVQFFGGIDDLFGDHDSAEFPNAGNLLDAILASNNN